MESLSECRCLHKFSSAPGGGPPSSLVPAAPLGSPLLENQMSKEPAGRGRRDPKEEKTEKMDPGGEKGEEKCRGGPERGSQGIQQMSNKFILL